jgi:3-oxoacyl-[acyl-carrier-protein] synthase-3
MKEKISVGIVSLGGFIPGKELNGAQKQKLVQFLKDQTLLPFDYIKMIDDEGRLPGYAETNYEGWESQPWYDAWLRNLPEKKRENPFQGAVERRRVCNDPISVKNSMHPHPMLPSDAETIAGALALMNSDIAPDDIDLVITHSQVQDYPLPTNASLIQHKLKLKNAMAFAVDSCCSTFVTMVEVASAMVKSGVKKNILVVNSIIDTMINDKSDYYSVNTGDMAFGAIISSVEEGCGYLGSASSSHGSRHDGVIFQKRSPHLLQNWGSGPTYEQDFVTFYNKEACREIGANAQTDLMKVIDELQNKSGIETEAIDFFVTHQPVAWAGNAWREALGVPEAKFYSSFEKYGNVATCSVPVNLLEAIEQKKIKANDTVLMASPGAGENHIALFQRISPKLVKNVLAFHEEKVTVENAVN